MDSSHVDSRKEALVAWLAQQLNSEDFQIQIASGDASFRRYFRVIKGNDSWIAMDAPPEHEDCRPFVAIAKQWQAAGLRTPSVVAEDLDLGYLLLSDFGDQVLLPLLRPEQPDISKGQSYYTKAMAALVQIQQISSKSLPSYDTELLQREMSLFPDWLLEEKLGWTLSEEEKAMLAGVFEYLEKSALAQKQLTVHRDYHSRNIMILDDGELGIIDFQDAVEGAASYDLVSLLRDCYIVWPAEQVDNWVSQYWELASNRGILNVTLQQFRKDFDLMGMQRHIKVAGIFARLSIRDGKHGYLADIPRTLDYLIAVAGKYEVFSEFAAWLKVKVRPAVAEFAV